MQHSSKKSLWIVLKKTFAMVFTLVLLSLFAIQAKAGADSYEIYLNNKLVLKQYVTQPLNIKSLQLNKVSSDDRLVIYYSHCGQTGKGRSIVIKDEKEKILKEWKFDNVKGTDKGMVISIKELLQLAKNNANLVLYYKAEGLQKARMLTSLDLRKSNVTFSKTHTKNEQGVTFMEIFGLGRFLG